MAIQKKRGLSNRRSKLKRNVVNGTSSSSFDVNQQNENYKTRLESAGVNTEAATDKRNAVEKFLNLEKDQNVLFDIMELLGRSQNSVFTGIKQAQEGGNFLEGLKEGYFGEDKTTGKDILVNAGMDDTEGKIDLSDVLGIGLDIFADPVDLALIPATGGASAAAKAAASAGVKTAEAGLKAAEAGAKAAKVAKAGAKVAKAADKVDDVAKAARALDKAKKIEAAADDAYKIASKSLLFNNGKKFTSVSNILGKGTGKLIKGTGKLADKAIAGTLSKIDSKQAKNIQKMAEKAGMTVEDYTKLHGLDNIGTRANDYQTLKDTLKKTFNRSNTTIGKMEESARESEGMSDYAKRVFNSYLDPQKEKSYNYVLSTLKDANPKELKSLQEYLGKEKATISKWIKENEGTKLAQDLISGQSKVGEDVLNVLESMKDTSINGRNVLNSLSNGYEFKGTKKSTNALASILDEIGAKSGQEIKYTTDLYDDARYAKELKEIDNQRTLLNEQLKSGEITRDVFDKESKNLDDLINRMSISKNSTLKIDDIRDVEALKNNPEVQKLFDDADLKYGLEYNTKEQQYLNDLKNNPEFMNLVNDQKNATNEAARIIKEATGEDFSDITSREGYVRRAKGTAQDTDLQLANLEDQLKNPDIDADTKAVIQNNIDQLKSTRNMNNSNAQNVFGKRKYEQPAMVANRQFQEKNADMISQNKKAIQETKENIENTKKMLEAKKKGISASDYVKSNISEKAINIQNRIQKNKAKLNKLGIRSENVNKSIEKVSDIASKTMDKINDELIDKAMQIQDTAVSKKFSKQLTNVNKYSKQYDKLTKDLETIGDLDDKAVNKLLNNLETTSNKMINEYSKLEKTTAIIDGKVDNKLLTEIKNINKSVEDYAKQQTKLSGLKSLRDNILSNTVETKKSITDLSDNLTKQINKETFTFDSINEGTLRKQEAKLSALSQAESLLKSDEGATLFNLNYYAGLDDFVNNAALRSKSIGVFRNAIATGVFSDSSIIKAAEDLTNGIPKGYTRVNGTKLSNNLRNMMSNLIDESSDKFTKDYLTDLAKSWEGKTIVMDTKAANLLGVIKKTTSDDEVKGFLNIIDKINNTFKRFSTLTPGFQLRNELGNATNMYLSGMSPTAIMTYKEKAARLLNNSNDLISKVAQNGIDSLTAAEKADYNILQQFFKGQFNNAGTAVRDLDKIEEGIQKAALEGNKNIVSKGMNKVTELNNKLNNLGDSWNRMALLMYANDNPSYLRKLGVDDPIKAVKYALMDPSGLSEFEAKYMKRLIPFYTFTKQNLMFQSTNILKNTTKYNRLMKSINSLYKNLDEDSYYSYQKDAMQIPIPGATDDEGNQLFLKANLPLSDLGEFLSDPLGRSVSSITPIIKAPVEMKTGKSLFTGDDTTYNTLSKTLNKMGVSSTDTAGKSIMNAADAADLILNNMGLQNVTTNMIKKVQKVLEAQDGEASGQQVWAEIFRSMLQNANQDTIENSKAYEEMENYQALIKQLKSQGYEVPTMKEINSASNNTLRRLKRKRSMLSSRTN